MGNDNIIIMMKPFEVKLYSKVLIFSSCSYKPCETENINIYEEMK